MTEPSSEALRLFYNPAACTILRKVLRNPERWAKYQDVIFEQFTEVAKEAGYNDPEVIALAYESFKYVAGLSRDEAQKLLDWLEGVKENGQTARQR